ncbi:MAG: DUF2283 domain-containing protein [Bacillota bacterium]
MKLSFSEEGITMDLDDNNCVIGLEILDASEKLRDGLTKIELSGVPAWKTPHRQVKHAPPKRNEKEQTLLSPAEIK